MTARTPEIISIPPNKVKSLNSPVDAKSRHISEAGGLGSVANGLTVCRDTQSVAADAKTTKIASRNVSTCPRSPRSPNSPLKVERPKQQKHVDIEINDTYAPHNAAVETWAREIEIALGRCVEVMSRSKVIKAIVEVERDGSRDSEWNGDVDGTSGGDDDDSNPVSKHATMQKHNETTYQCCPSHPCDEYG